MPKQIHLNSEPPKGCSNCDFEAVRIPKNNPNQAVNPENAWVAIMVPNAPTMLFGCPKCLTLHMGVNTVDNMKIVRAEQESRIIKPTFAGAVPKKN
jgi:hypothetical protein